MSDTLFWLYVNAAVAASFFLFGFWAGRRQERRTLASAQAGGE